MRILVTGATGNVGRLVVNHLLGQGVEIRALTNNPEKAALPPASRRCQRRWKASPLSPYSTMDTTGRSTP